MSAARTERLLNLLTLLLNTRRPVSLREIREMDEFGAYRTADPKSGERAFERDKSALVELGVPLRWVAPEEEDEGEATDGIGGYIIDREKYYLTELNLDPAEVALLSIAGAAAVAIEHFPGRAAIIRALAKIGFDVEESSPSVTLAHAPIQPGADVERVGRNLEALHDAVARRRTVQIGYDNAAGERTDRRVDPFGLYYRAGIWYLVGYCHLRAGERTFHLGRMQSVELVTRAPKAGPEFDVPASFDLSAHVKRQPWEYGAGQSHDVVIRLAGRLVPAINEIFGSGARVERTEDGALVRLAVRHEGALIAAVLPFGAAAVVLEPVELRDRIGEIYRALAGRYGEELP